MSEDEQLELDLNADTSDESDSGLESTSDEDFTDDLIVLPEEDDPQDHVYLSGVLTEIDADSIERIRAEFDDDDALSVNIADGYRAVPVLKTFINDSAADSDIYLPAWADQWAAESGWANSIKWSSMSAPRLVWSVDETLVFQSPYIMSMDDRLHALIEDVEWSDRVGGWIFPWFDDDMLEELKSIVDDYNFTMSGSAQTLLNGGLESEVVIDETIDNALEAGYRIPSIFPTERSLKEHQKRGVLSALDRRRVLLADSPGLGKGGIFVSVFLAEWERAIRDHFEFDADEDIEIDFEYEEVQEVISAMSPVVLICQTSMVMPLANEILHWWHDATIEIVKGQASAEISDCNFVICPISVVAARIDDILATQPRGLIVDEAHMLKNPDSKRTQAVQQLADHINAVGDELVEEDEIDTTMIILASGTPMPNRPSELWSLLCVLGEQQMFAEAALEEIGESTISQPYKRNGRTNWTRREMTDKELFERHWCRGGFGKQALVGGMAYVWMNFGASNLSELHKLLTDTVMIRRKKRDVILLPAPYERIVPTPLTEEQTAEYQEIKENFREYMYDLADEYAEKWGVSTQAAIGKLRFKIDFAEPLMRLAKLTQFVSKSKVEQIVLWVKRFMESDPDIVTENADKRRKLIVFAHHIETQEQLVNNEELQQYGMATILAGAKNVVEETERFQKDDDCRLIICYSGAREGHTLTAAYDVLIAEPPPVPSQAEQMACRCYARVSEDFEPHIAYVHYAITPQTVDVLQLRRMNMKKGISDAVIDGEDDPSKNDKKERERLNAYEREAEAELIMEMVMGGDETLRIAT